MSRYSRLGWSLFVGGLAFTLGATTASAQGRGRGHEKQEAREQSRRDDDHDRRDHVPPGQAKKRYTPVQAVDVTRDVFRSHGYQVVRVERVGYDQVIYYYRGNNGRGRGHGPMERMVIRPDHERLVLISAPSPLFAELRIRLGL